MIDMSAQRKEFDIVISDITRCYYDFTDFYDYLNKSGFLWYLAKHDKDKYANGEDKLVHLHLVLLSDKLLRAKQVLSHLADVLYTNVENIQIDEVNSIPGAIQYLLHKNNPEKYQYDESIIETNDERKNLHNILKEDIKRKVLTTKVLYDYVFEDKLSRRQLMEKIGIAQYQHYRPTINDLFEMRRLLTDSHARVR